MHNARDQVLKQALSSAILYSIVGQNYHVSRFSNAHAQETQFSASSHIGPSEECESDESHHRSGERAYIGRSYGVLYSANQSRGGGPGTARTGRGNHTGSRGTTSSLLASNTLVVIIKQLLKFMKCESPHTSCSMAGVRVLEVVEQNLRERYQFDQVTKRDKRNRT
jgi:hypothetical protein